MWFVSIYPNVIVILNSRKMDEDVIDFKQICFKFDSNKGKYVLGGSTILFLLTEIQLQFIIF